MTPPSETPDKHRQGTGTFILVFPSFLILTECPLQLHPKIATFSLEWGGFSPELWAVFSSFRWSEGLTRSIFSRVVVAWSTHSSLKKWQEKRVFLYLQHREHSVLSFTFSVFCDKTETPVRKNGLVFLRIFVFIYFFFCRSLKMAVLLIFVILLHLLTLAMLFIATMEKVVMGGWQAMSVWRRMSAVLCFVSHFSFQSWWEWGGLENSDLWYNCRFDNFTEIWLCASSKETGKERRIP